MAAHDDQAQRAADWYGLRPYRTPSTPSRPPDWPLKTRATPLVGQPAPQRNATTCATASASEARTTFGTPTRPGWRTPASPPG